MTWSTQVSEMRNCGHCKERSLFQQPGLMSQSNTKVWSLGGGFKVLQPEVQSLKNRFPMQSRMEKTDWSLVSFEALQHELLLVQSEIPTQNGIEEYDWSWMVFRPFSMSYSHSLIIFRPFSVNCGHCRARSPLWAVRPKIFCHGRALRAMAWSKSLLPTSTSVCPSWRSRQSVAVMSCARPSTCGSSTMMTFEHCAVACRSCRQLSWAHLLHPLPRLILLSPTSMWVWADFCVAHSTVPVWGLTVLKYFKNYCGMPCAHYC